jgi:hypothetical protein
LLAEILTKIQRVSDSADFHRASEREETDRRLIGAIDLEPTAYCRIHSVCTPNGTQCLHLTGRLGAVHQAEAGLRRTGDWSAYRSVVVELGQMCGS